MGLLLGTYPFYGLALAADLLVVVMALVYLFVGMGHFCAEGIRKA